VVCIGSFAESLPVAEPYPAPIGQCRPTALAVPRQGCGHLADRTAAEVDTADPHGEPEVPGGSRDHHRRLSIRREITAAKVAPTRFAGT
jgi:hypothetical protein